jgi:hypothetical protein
MMKEGPTRVEDLFLVVQELALRFEPVVKVMAVFPPTFLIALVRTLRDRTGGLGRLSVSRRWAIHAVGVRMFCVALREEVLIALSGVAPHDAP